MPTPLIFTVDGEQRYTCAACGHERPVLRHHYARVQVGFRTVALVCATGNDDQASGSAPDCEARAADELPALLKARLAVTPFFEDEPPTEPTIEPAVELGDDAAEPADIGMEPNAEEP